MTLPNHAPCNGLKCGRPAELHRPAHTPRNPVDGYCSCGALARYHRPSHKPKGDDLCECGALVSHHRKSKPHNSHKRGPWTKYIGLDGEGIGRESHRYVLMCAADASGDKRWHVENYDGLSTVECLDFLLDLPKDCRTFAYSMNYDLTMMLRDLPNDALFRLFRPELRRNDEGKLQPVHWGPYQLNLISTKFEVKRGRTKRVLWDVWKFYQCSFVNALKAWGIGTEASLEVLSGMKSARADFETKSPDEIRDYCFSECSKLAQLVKLLTEAHEATDLKLRSYYGPGSTATALFKRIKIRDYLEDPPPSMHAAVVRAFFGGRFEQSRIGPVLGPIYSFDISSAYPYHTTFLPCLTCGTWRYTKDYRNVPPDKHALVRWSYRKPITAPWAPFPHRDEFGQITYPAMCGGGWLWRGEFEAGRAIFQSNIRSHGAWWYDTDCDCQPFACIPELYRYRLALGKDGKGIVIKLGYNSVYGKLAQSVGVPKYQSWIWAGMITSGTRQQILEVLAMHDDFSNLLSVATDGIYTLENLSMPAPRKTDTPDHKPLGGWEAKEYPNGMFFVRPGVYFPLDANELSWKDVRARGLGKATLLAQYERISAEYLSGESGATIGSIVRFHGAKTSISYRPKTNEYVRSKNYGQWREREIKLSFSPLPKRARVRPDGTLELVTLDKRDLSKPYSRAALVLPDGTLTELGELIAAKAIDEEQPEFCYV